MEVVSCHARQVTMLPSLSLFFFIPTNPPPPPLLMNSACPIPSLPPSFPPFLLLLLLLFPAWIPSFTLNGGRGERGICTIKGEEEEMGAERFSTNKQSSFLLFPRLIRCKFRLFHPCGRYGSSHPHLSVCLSLSPLKKNSKPLSLTPCSL